IDEALAVGDEDFKKRSMARIEEMVGKTTVVIVSHSMNELKRLCTRLVLMEKGRIVLDGTGEESRAELLAGAAVGLDRK
ncbi:MAG TPA: ABC transporter ATP-binding protein, partial [Acidimicrobiia bacterium]|nr:ABC transporter ATP-binding protein [Acidimicrobiia bacterium]